MRLRLLLVAALMASTAALGADGQEAPVGASAGVTADDYRVGEGDVLSVKVYGEDAFSGTAVVAGGGVANFPFVGELPVDGMSIREVSELLRVQLEESYLVEPKVSVWVDTYGSQEVRVLGAVKSPGVYFLRKPTRITEILAQAGGVLEDQHVTEVQVRSGDDSQRVLSVQALLESGEGDALVSRGDTIYLPAGEVVYLSGQVESPGAVSMGKGLTLLQALTRAGGPTESARLAGAYILRDGERVSVNIRRILKGRDADIQLMPGDQVVIQQSVF